MKEAKQTFFLGTAVKITSVINVAGCSSVKVTIYDPGYAKKVDAANMTGETSTVYSYVYQSSTSDNYGDYIVHIDAAYGGYTGRTEVIFTLDPLPSTGITS